uniref:Uncharacterized protein LOC113785477 n=1 Tax=Cicer arietinum TaxID=3827 RepID=A0A3Q7X273_CICAR|nr:uncharacterized protein LOC113785477 [Cicer arietinum]
MTDADTVRTFNFASAAVSTASKPEKVAWLPEHNFQINNIFNTKGSMRLSDMLMQARKKRKCSTWMGETVWNDLEKIWMDPSFKKISNQAKKNRASSKGGAVHTGGSISITEHTIRLTEELGRNPTLDEVFLTTHTKKKDNSLVDERAKKTYETYQGKLQQASKNGEASSSCSQVVNAEARLDMWVQSVGGKNKWRIYGAGDRSSLYRPGVIAAQIATFEERAKAAEHEAREAREELRKAEQRRQEDEQRTKELQIQLVTLAKSVASIQAESSRRRRHPDYDEDESNDDDGDE